MHITPQVQAVGTAEDRTIGATLARLLRQRSYAQLQVAMAYVSVAGARVLIQACATVPDLKSDWLIGLDDLVTQPGAIDLVRSLPGSQVRIASLGTRPFRFHPKLCRAVSAGVPRSELVMIGSANLTNAGLSGNSEAVVFLESTTGSESESFERMWSDLWSQGHTPHDDELVAYRQRYEQAQPLRTQLRELQNGSPATAVPPSHILERDTAELDPSKANTCWIECGSITGMGRELELKAEQGLFFGLNSEVQTEQLFDFRVSTGVDVRLKLKYQENGMWRVQMNKKVPEVGAGLRPTLPDGSLGRSQYVAVFSKNGEAEPVQLTFLHVDSQEFAALKTRSRKLGTSSRTQPGMGGRDYGWC